MYEDFKFDVLVDHVCSSDSLVKPDQCFPVVVLETANQNAIIMMAVRQSSGRGLLVHQ